MIVKKDDGWYVVSEAHKDKEGSPKNLGGPYDTEEEAKARLKEVEAFKHMEEVSHIPHIYIISHEHQAEIFSVGKWNNDEYTIDDLHDMVRNFSSLADDVKPPVKLGHADAALNKVVLDGQPAYGWVKALKVVGQKLVAHFTGVPDVLMKAIKAGRYKRVSSEIYWNYKKGDNIFKRVLGAVAFLGADAPAVTNLADLEALLTQSTGANIAAGSFERKAAYSFKSEDGEHIKEEERRETMPVDEKELADAKAENTRLSAALDAVTQANLVIKKNAAASTVREYCEAQVKKGLMAPSTRDGIMKGIKEDKYAYSEQHGYAIPFHEFTTIYDVKSSAKARVEFGQRGDAREHEDIDEDDDIESEHNYDSKGRTAGEEVDRLTKKYMAANKVDYSSAMKSVLQGNQKLARAYIEATPIIKHESEGASSAADVDGEG